MFTQRDYQGRSIYVTIISRLHQKSDEISVEYLTTEQGAKGFYKKSAAEQERLKLSEIQHCRLAMLAITGELVQMMLYHTVGDVRLPFPRIKDPDAKVAKSKSGQRTTRTSYGRRFYHKPLGVARRQR